MDFRFRIDQSRLPRGFFWSISLMLLYLVLAVFIETRWAPKDGFVRHAILLPNHKRYKAIFLESRRTVPGSYEKANGATVYVHLLGDDKHHLVTTTLKDLDLSSRSGIVKAANKKTVGDSYDPETYLAWFQSIGLDTNTPNRRQEAAELIQVIAEVSSARSDMSDDLREYRLEYCEVLGVRSSSYYGFLQLPSLLQMTCLAIWMGGVLVGVVETDKG